MKKYKEIISLSKNGRGIWDLDTTKGCKSGLEYNEKGCYNDCYAFKIAKRYGIDFSKTILRNFESESHKQSIIKSIEKIDMPFVRIGCSGDPSENWEHTINIIEQLRTSNQLSLFDISSKKQIVIITKHWKTLTDKQLIKISKYNICINTSVSALDDIEMIEKTVNEYNRLKPFCKSVLRIVSCDFNLENKKGKELFEIQKNLFMNENVLDTVFRPSLNNYFVKENIIKIKKMSFNKSLSYVSKYNKKAFTGKCENCLEMCGLNI